MKDLEMVSEARTSITPRYLRALLAMGLAIPLIGCPFVTSSGSGTGDTQSLLQRALFREQQVDGSAQLAQASISSRAHYNFLLGEIALADERAEEALEYFEEAAKADPSASPTLRLRLAGLYLQQKQLDNALKQLAIITQADPDNLGALQLKAGVLATLGKQSEAIDAYRRLISLKGAETEEPYIFAASLHLQGNQLDEAGEILQELLVAHPKSFFGHYYLARIAEAQSRFAAAEMHYHKALEFNPRADSVRLELARLHGAQKRFAEGVALIDEVLTRDENNVEAKTLRAQLLVGENNLEAAIDEFEEVSVLEENSAKTRFKIALIKLQRRNIPGAITDLNLVLAATPDDTAARYYLASAYASIGKIGEALQQIKAIESDQEYFTESRTLGAFMLQRDERYDEAISLVKEVLEEEEEPKILAFLANLQKESGDSESAIKSMKRLTELEPDNDQHYFTLGVYYDQSEDMPRAVEAMRKAIEINPKNANALNYLGYTFAEQATNLKEAQELIERALEIEPENGYYIDSLGWVYFQVGDYEAARRELERAVALVPNDAVILEHLAIVYQKLGLLDQAKKIAEKALEHAGDSDDAEVTGRLKKLLSTLP